MVERISAMYDGNSALGKMLTDFGTSVYGNQAQNELYRQKAFGSKRENDNAEPYAAALRDNNLPNQRYYGAMTGRQNNDLANGSLLSVSGNVSDPSDPRLDVAARGAGAAFNSTAAGQSRALANDRTTTGMNNATSIDVAHINGENQHRTQMDIADRTPVRTQNDDGSYGYYSQADANARHLTPVITQNEAQGGVVSKVFRDRGAQPPASPFTTGAPGWNASAPAPQPAAAAPRPGTVNGGIYGQRTPQELQILGGKEMPMIHPGTGKTGTSWDNGATLADGTPATGYVPASNDAVLAAEKANNVRAQAATPLPPKTPGYSQYAQDAYTAGGPGAAIQHDVNAMKGLVGQGEYDPNTNRARENLTNTNNTVRSLYASAPGTRAAVYREKNADRALPDANNFLGITGINADQQRNRADSEITHLREQYALVQADATNPQTPPEEAQKMLAWMHSAKDALATMDKPQAAPTAGAQPVAAAPQAAPTAGAPSLPTLTPEQAAAAPPGTEFLTTTGEKRVRH